MRCWCAILLLGLSGCPNFPDESLHYEASSGDKSSGDGPCVDRDGDGVTTCDNDCDDDQRDIHEGQRAFFEEPLGARRFDYNCDGEEERQETAIADCREEGDGCAGEGWSESVPDCGESGTYDTCQLTGKKCTPRGEERIQSCR